MKMPNGKGGCVVKICKTVGACIVFDCLMCWGDSVARVRRNRLLFEVGSKSGKRKRGRAGIFDFLFLNFFATKIRDFPFSHFLLSSLFSLSFTLSRHFFI